MSDVITQTKDDDERLWVTDAELIRRSRIPEKVMRQALQSFDKAPRGGGFPPKVKLFGDRRYWPAVVAYFERVGGLTMLTSVNQRGHND